MSIGELVGTIKMHGGSTAPYGYFICDGSLVSRTTYKALFSVIGTTYGEGDGSTTFAIPDFRELSPVGIGTNNTHTIASHDTFELGEMKDDQFQGHWHNLMSEVKGSSGGGYGFVGSGYVGGSSPNDKTWTEMWATTPITDKTNGTPRTGEVTRSKQLGVNFIIKY